MEPLNTTRQATVAFSAALGLLVLMSWYAYDQVVNLRRDAAVVENAQQTLAGLWAVLATVTDAETAQRGYTVTGIERFLEPWHVAISRLPGELEALERLTAHSAAQRARADRLARLVETRIARSRGVIELRRDQGFEAARQEIAAGGGQALQDQIRTLVATMTAAEENELTLDLQRAALSGTTALTLIVSGTAIAALIVVLCYLLVRRAAGASARARADLEVANARLETRVADRTADLARLNERLAQNARDLRVIVEQAPLAMALFDRDLRYLAVSRRWLAEYARGHGDLTGLGHYDLYPNLPAHWRQAHARALAGESVRQDEECWIDEDGAEQWLRWALNPWRDESGAVGGVILVAEDVTQQRRLEQRQRLADAVFTNTQEAIVITDLACRIIAVNPAFSVVSEYPEAELVGQHMRLVQSGRHDASFYRGMWEAILVDGSWQGEIWNRRKGGEIYPEWLAIGTVRDREGKPLYYVGVGTDVSRMEHAETRLERLAQYDALTDLPNRVLLRARLEHSLERAGRGQAECAVLYLDLDGFKEVNDTAGHACGDELLCLAAARMGSRLREVDTLARLGGDEFIIVLEDIANRESAARVAEDLVDAMRAPFALGGGRSVTISASIGISLFPRDGTTAEALLAQADKALYAAKGAGGSTWRYATAPGAPVAAPGLVY